MPQFLFAALYSKCRTVPPTERPLDTCILYRHKEDLPLDGAPFFDIYADEQQPDHGGKSHTAISRRQRARTTPFAALPAVDYARTR